MVYMARLIARTKILAAEAAEKYHQATARFRLDGHSAHPVSVHSAV